jgi:hypothetical protein
MLKFRCETSIGYDSQKCLKAVQGGLFGGHKSTPVKPLKHMPFPPACSIPLITKNHGQLAGSVHENGQHLTTQSVWYHSLSDTISFCLLASYGLLPTRQGYMAYWVESLCMYCIALAETTSKRSFFNPLIPFTVGF